MKCLLALCFLSMLALSMAGGCRYYIMGKCVGECPEGTHTYSSACKQKIPEATCDQPNPEPEGGSLCDYFACYCDPPTVRDTTTNKCVPLEECPKNE